jgi:hypothetical protein
MNYKKCIKNNYNSIFIMIVMEIWDVASNVCGTQSYALQGLKSCLSLFRHHAQLYSTGVQ